MFFGFLRCKRIHGLNYFFVTFVLIRAILMRYQLALRSACKGKFKAIPFWDGPFVLRNYRNPRTIVIFSLLRSRSHGPFPISLIIFHTNSINFLSISATSPISDIPSQRIIDEASSFSTKSSSWYSSPTNRAPYSVRSGP